MGTVQQLLPQPVDEATERAFDELLQRKLAGAVGLFVQAVRAAQELYGPDAAERIRAQMLQKWVAAAVARGEQSEDRSVRAYCAAMDLGCRGSHEWEKLEDGEERQAYRYTRCLWADVFRAQGAEDLGLWICRSDGPVAAAFNPRIRFQRTQTLMEGDECCDHVYCCEDGAGEGDP